MLSGTIAIFGAGGFVGHWLRRELEERRLPVWPSGPGDHIDILDPVALRSLLGELQPRAVINLAAIASPSVARQKPRSAWSVNFQGTMNVVEAILDVSSHTRLVAIGSAEEYGATFNTNPAPLNEHAPLAPTSTYGASKAAADLLVGQMVHDGLRAVRLRPFNHSGPGQAPAYVVAAFARQVARIAAGLQAPTIEVGNLEAVRDFLDVRDVVRAYVDIAFADDSIVQGKVFNLSSGRGVRIGDILDALITTAGIAPRIVSAATQLRHRETPRIVGDSGAIQRAIGWTPQIAFQRTLEDVLAEWTERVQTEAGT